MSRYDNVEKIQNKNVTTIGTSYLPKFKEDNSDVLLIATEGDRCDLISQEYYGTPDFWWYVASVNNLKSITYTVNEQGDWDALRSLPRYFDIAISYQILSKKPPSLGDDFYSEYDKTLERGY